MQTNTANRRPSGLSTSIAILHAAAKRSPIEHLSGSPVHLQTRPIERITCTAERDQGVAEQETASMPANTSIRTTRPAPVRASNPAAGLLLAPILALSGCGWFGSGSTPTHRALCLPLHQRRLRRRLPHRRLPERLSARHPAAQRLRQPHRHPGQVLHHPAADRRSRRARRPASRQPRSAARHRHRQRHLHRPRQRQPPSPPTSPSPATTPRPPRLHPARSSPPPARTSSPSSS